MNTLPDEAAPRVPVNVAIVGAQKAGTSSLFDLLRKHPGVCPGPRKEWHYFDDEKRSWEDPDHSGYWAPGRSERQRIAIDGTPSYMFWPHAMERMRAYRPDMRLIVSLRDPIERCFSHWAMYFGKLASFPSFSELAQGPPREALLDRIPAGWNHLRMRRWSMVPRGLYGAQIQRGLALFPREQWLFLDFHGFVGDHRATLDRTTRFLDLEPYSSAPPLQVIQSTRGDLVAPPPTSADVSRLAELYADDLDVLTRLSGLDVSGWSTRQVLDGRLDASDLADQLAHKAGLLHEG
jgi:hypothetical protein